MARRTKKTSVTRKKASASERQTNAARYAKQRERRQFFESALKWAGVAAGLVVLGLLGWGVIWSTQPGRLESWYMQTEESFWQMTARNGFAVNDMFITGRESVPLDAVKQAIGLRQGDPILSVSVETLRERLESLPSIKTALVKRELPGTLRFHITERKPIAIWQHKQTLHLIDDQGVVMSNSNIKDFPNLLLVVGKDAPANASKLLEFLAMQEILYPQVKSAIRVGGRRWNIRLQNGIEVKLPEENPAKAWALLAKMEQDEGVLERNIVGIDLRLNDRIYFRLPSSAPTNSNATNNNSET